MSDKCDSSSGLVKYALRVGLPIIAFEVICMLLRNVSVIWLFSKYVPSVLVRPNIEKAAII